MLEMQGLAYYVINSTVIPSGEITIQLNKDTINQCKKKDALKFSLQYVKDQVLVLFLI